MQNKYHPPIITVIWQESPLRKLWEYVKKTTDGQIH